MVRRPSEKGERTSASNTFSNVHEMKTTELFQAWTPVECTGQARGPYVGGHETKRLAARAQDRALLKLRKSAEQVKLNFSEEDHACDKRLREVLTDKEFLELLRRESRARYKPVEPTKCLKKFLEEEGRKKPEPKTARMPLADFLFELLMAREEDLTSPPMRTAAPWGQKREFDGLEESQPRTSGKNLVERVTSSVEVGLGIIKDWQIDDKA